MENVHYIQDDNKSTASIVGQIIENGQKLISQEILLAKTEVGGEYLKLKALFALSMGLAVSLGFTLVLATLCFVHLLSYAGWDDWAVYGSLAAVYAVASAVMYFLLSKARLAKAATFKGEPNAA